MKIRLAVAVAAVALTAGCGSATDSPSPNSTPSANTAPSKSVPDLPPGVEPGGGAGQVTCLQFTKAVDGTFQLGGPPEAFAKGVLSGLIHDERLQGSPDAAQNAAFFAALRKACADPTVAQSGAADVATGVYQKARESYNPKS